MIKLGLHSVSSLLMAFLVLVSTVSFTVEKHYCGDHLVDVAINSEAKKCGMMDSDSSFKKKTCCNDTLDVFDGQDELKTSSSVELDYAQQVILTSFVYSYVDLFEGLSQNIIPHKTYVPPDIVPDIQLLEEVFLI